MKLLISKWNDLPDWLLKAHHSQYLKTYLLYCELNNKHVKLNAILVIPSLVTSFMKWVMAVYLSLRFAKMYWNLIAKCNSLFKLKRILNQKPYFRERAVYLDFLLTRYLLERYLHMALMAKATCLNLFCLWTLLI